MSFTDAVATCFRKYAEFDGRSRRPEYWWFQLFTLLLSLLVLAQPVLAVLALFATLLPSLAVLVRRLHDTGHSGAFFFISLIPLIGSIILLVTLVSSGDPGENQYGPPPSSRLE